MRAFKSIVWISLKTSVALRWHILSGWLRLNENLQIATYTCQKEDPRFWRVQRALQYFEVIFYWFGAASIFQAWFQSFYQSSNIRIFYTVLVWIRQLYEFYPYSHTGSLRKRSSVTSVCQITPNSSEFPTLLSALYFLYRGVVPISQSFLVDEFGFYWTVPDLRACKPLDP